MPDQRSAPSGPVQFAGLRYISQAIFPPAEVTTVDAAASVLFQGDVVVNRNRPDFALWPNFQICVRGTTVSDNVQVVFSTGDNIIGGSPAPVFTTVAIYEVGIPVANLQFAMMGVFSNLAAFPPEPVIRSIQITGRRSAGAGTITFRQQLSVLDFWEFSR